MAQTTRNSGFSSRHRGRGGRLQCIAWQGPSGAADDPTPAMKLELKPFDFAQAVARAGLRPDGTPIGGLGGAGAAGRAAAAQEPGAVEGASFSTAMTQALKAVSDAQLESQRLQRELQLDNPTVSLEQTMVAMNKSQVGFTAALTVRNRLVQAYSDIMNMQV